MADESGRGIASGGAEPQPVSEPQRAISVDALRGVALLGILVMNIPWFAFYSAAFFNPRQGGGFDGLNFGVWLGAHLFFDTKMMALFSMLFGAGVVLMAGRIEGRGGSAAGVYYRRIAWLLVIGLLHAYLLWMGDILVSYALCGLALYPLRRWRPRRLIVLGSLMLIIGAAITSGQGHFFAIVQEQAAEAVAAEQAGKTPTTMQKAMLESWNEISAEFDPTEEKLAEEQAGYQAGYLGYIAFNAPRAAMMHSMYFLIWALWRAGGLMLIGMGLMRLGVFSAERSNRFYLWMGALGYGLGLPLVGAGVYRMFQHDFSFIELFKFDWMFNYFGSVGVALGHAAVVMLVVRSGAARKAVNALAAVGRMALTNYLMQSLLLSLVFLGWGAGLWGRMDRVGTMGVVLVIWTAQLIFSQVWLAQYRFGPVEWAWRSLTYWKPQPMRRADA